MKHRGFTKQPCDGLEEFIRAIPDADHKDIKELALRFAIAFEDDYYRDRAMNAEKILQLKKIVKQIGLFRPSPFNAGLPEPEKPSLRWRTGGDK